MVIRRVRALEFPAWSATTTRSSATIRLRALSARLIATRVARESLILTVVGTPRAMVARAAGGL